MFTIQLIRVVLFNLQIDAMYLTIGINQQLNGITPTIILLRVAMGLSFYDQKSMEETVGSLRFVSRNENPNSETGDMGDTVGQECDDIQVVDRWSTSIIEV